MIAVTYMICIVSWILMRVLRDKTLSKIMVDVVATVSLIFITKFFIENTL